MTARILGVGLEQFQKRARGEDVVAHGCVDATGVTWHGGGIGILFVEGHDSSVLVGLNDPEFTGLHTRNRDRGDGDLRVLCLVEVDHAGNVHAVDVVASENGNQVRIGLLHQIDVLEDGIGRTLVPGLVLRTHLCRHVDDEVALQHSAELPSLAQMLQQRLAAELGEHIDRVDSGIDEITENEIDDPVFASERNRRLGALPREGEEPGPFATGKYNAQYLKVQGTFFGDGGLALRGHIFRRLALPEQFCCRMLSEVAAES